MMSLAKSLRKMAELLDLKWSHNIANTDVLKKDIKNYSYAIDLSNALIFRNINVGRHIRPNIDLTLSDLEVKLSSKISLEKKAKQEVLNSIGVNFVIGGECFLKNSNQVVDLSFAFHIDYDESSSTNFYHPFSHLQIGGGALKNVDTGSLLKIEHPRFSHYPMDVILAIDFIIRNFYTTNQHSNLTKDDEYRNLVKESATKYIKPYIEGIYSYWNTEFENNNFKPWDAICSLQ